MLQALSEKAKAETQFIQQLKAMTELIPVSMVYTVDEGIVRDNIGS